jgi:hypothetical protein
MKTQHSLVLVCKNWKDVATPILYEFAVLDSLLKLTSFVSNPDKMWSMHSLSAQSLLFHLNASGEIDNGLLLVPDILFGKFGQQFKHL